MKVASGFRMRGISGGFSADWQQLPHRKWRLAAKKD
jgi:hypothetical protein